MNVTIEFKDEDVDRLLTQHAGHYSDWIHTINGTLLDGFEIIYDKEGEPEGMGNGKMKVDMPEIAKGLAIMAREATHSFAEWCLENDDDISFDSAWQCIVFGKLVYA